MFRTQDTKPHNYQRYHPWIWYETPLKKIEQNVCQEWSFCFAKEKRSIYDEHWEFPMLFTAKYILVLCVFGTQNTSPHGFNSKRREKVDISRESNNISDIPPNAHLIPQDFILFLYHNFWERFLKLWLPHVNPSKLWGILQNFHVIGIKIWHVFFVWDMSKKDHVWEKIYLVFDTNGVIFQ